MKFKRFMALAMAGVMTLGMATVASAAPDDYKIEPIVQGEGTVESPTAKKTVKMADGITLSQDITFSGSALASLKNSDGTDMPAVASDLEAKATLAFTDAMKNQAQDVSITVSAKEGKTVETITPGQYTFELKEDTLTPAVTDGTGWKTVDDTVYHLRMYVPQTGATVYAIWNANETVKYTAADFTNVYVKKAGSEEGEDAASFTLKKELSQGEYADATTKYKFALTITLPDAELMADMPENGYAVTSDNGSVAADTFTTGGNLTVEILADETVSIADLPVGTKITVVENEIPSNVEKTFFTVKANGVDDGQATTERTSVSDIALGEHENSVVVKNQYKTITPTGLAISVAPFVAMFAAVGAAIALYVAAKRRVR